MYKALGFYPNRDRKKQSLLLAWLYNTNYSSNFVNVRLSLEVLRLDWWRLRAGHMCTCPGPVTLQNGAQVPQGNCRWGLCAASLSGRACTSALTDDVHSSTARTFKGFQSWRYFSNPQFNQHPVLRILDQLASCGFLCLDWTDSLYWGDFIAFLQFRCVWNNPVVIPWA